MATESSAESRIASWRQGIAARCRRLTGSAPFQHGVMILILFNAAVMGLETSARATRDWGDLLGAANTAIQAAFVTEIALRLLAHRPVASFFRDGWNVFDFLVIALSLLPSAGSFATLARVARVLRVARLLSYSPELRLIIGTMLRSIPSLGHVVALLAILLYVYGVLGHQLFHAHDPRHWASLGTALLTLFQILTLEGWAEIQGTALELHPWAWLYFTSFVVIAVFVVINLFIAVVLNNLEAVKEEERAARNAGPDDDAALRRKVSDLRERLDAFEAALDRRAQG